MRNAEEWVRAQFNVTWLTPTDAQGETIVWGEHSVKGVDGFHIGMATLHTYLADFLTLAAEVIENEDAFPDDAAVHDELKRRQLRPEE